MPPPPPRITPSQILHPVPRPITFLEFAAALRACAPPRFPRARVAQPRRVLLAVSGGLDSMALAFLFNQHREITPAARVVDNRLARIAALVVDHRLRPGSAEEAAAVAAELKRFRHVSPTVAALDWKRDAGVESGDPADAPNLESLARRARYRRIGAFCRSLHAESVFLAHHEDDQHETVLMRLLAGHGRRGLRGIMPRADIPECHDMHGVHESGHLDDQAMRVPPLSFRPPRREWPWVRRELSDELDWDAYSAEARAGSQQAPYTTDPHEEDMMFFASSAGARARAAAAAEAVRNVPRVETEDAGVMLYRPLLGFGKDRLRATCEFNKIRWFEDPTNEDRTLTMRNAVRHMLRNHELPRALSKESILRLSARCDAGVRAQEGEAERWIRRGVVARFEPNAGTLVVELPSMAVPSSKRRRSSTTITRKRRELRLAHRRTIAALVVRKLLSFVSPDKNHAQLASLQSVVPRLFPSLAEDTTTSETGRKAFNHSSVLFLPVPAHPRKWYLTREPYPSNRPSLPETSFLTSSGGAHRRFPQFPPSPRPGSSWRDDATDTLVSLPASDLPHAEWLRRLHREPLPAPDASSKSWNAWRRFELWDGRFWIRVRGRVRACFRVAPFAARHARAFREGLADEKARARLEVLLKRFAPGKVRYTLPALYAVNRDEETGCEILRMLALPTLGVQLPGLERWARYEVRYRKVDWELLGRDEDGE